MALRNAQRQDSLSDQLRTVINYAADQGCYDAIDFIERKRDKDFTRALEYEADVIEAQSQDVKTLSQGRRHHLKRCADRLRRVAQGEYPYSRVSYGKGLTALPDDSESLRPHEPHNPY